MLGPTPHRPDPPVHTVTLWPHHPPCQVLGEQGKSWHLAASPSDTSLDYLPGVPLPAALVLCLPALLKQGCLIEGHSAASGAGGQEALSLGVLALRVLPPQFGVCEENQERVGPRWAEPGAGRLWAGLRQGKERGGGRGGLN